MTVALAQTTTVVPIFAVSGDAVMSADDEQQWAFTAHDGGGPLAPLPIRTMWAQRFHSGDVPHHLLGEFTAPGPFQGQIDVHVTAARAWGSGGAPNNSFGGGGFALILADTTRFVLPRPPYGPDPLDPTVPGVVRPTNYPGANACGAILLQATYGVLNAPGGGFGLGYANDNVAGYSEIAPMPPWSNDPASIAGGYVQAFGRAPNSAWTGVPGPSTTNDPDPVWPLVAGRRYAVYAVPQALVVGWEIATAGRLGGGGWEDFPSFGSPGDHITVPSVAADYPFAWPAYDPPVIPSAWPAVDTTRSAPSGWTPAWLAGHDTHPGTVWSDLGGGLHPAGTPLYHYRTGQRFHAEATGITVSASGVLLSQDCTPACDACSTCAGGVCVTSCVGGETCVGGVCTGPSGPPAAQGGFPWWLVIGTGVVVAVAVAEKSKRPKAGGRR